PNAYAASATKKLLDRLYPLRKCHTMPDRACLYYHMGQCLAPCVKPVEKETYQEMIDDISRFLNGGFREVKQDLVEKMSEAAENLEFESANEYRDQISHIETVMEIQKMAMNDFTNRDVFGYAIDKGWMCVQVFFVRQGKLIERDVSLFPLYRDPKEEFMTFLGQFYEQSNHVKPNEILLPEGEDAELVREWLDMRVLIPQRGKKKDLVALAKKNAEIAIKEKFQ